MVPPFLGPTRHSYEETRSQGLSALVIVGESRTLAGHNLASAPPRYQVLGYLAFCKIVAITQRGLQKAFEYWILGHLRCGIYRPPRKHGK